MIAPDLADALGLVLDAFERLGVRHYVAGSLASSIHGVPRSSLDVDVVADLEPRHAGPLAGTLRDAFYVLEGRLVDAIAQRSSDRAIAEAGAR